jgi:hypothetical protein
MCHPLGFNSNIFYSVSVVIHPSEEHADLKVLATGPESRSAPADEESVNSPDVAIDGTASGLKKSDEKPKSKAVAFLSTLGFLREAEGHNAPQLSLLEIFKIFLWFGARAFGGPVVQISMMKSELVDDKKWISNELFNRVYAVYQILPGPEATELACYFGYLAGGRLGSLLGGLGFILPGCMLLYFWSWL